ncbi:MAG: outer membrane beta-barrel protein [Pseudomonadota bacterium]
MKKLTLVLLSIIIPHALLANILTSGYSVGFQIGGGINYYIPAESSINMRHPSHASFAWGLHLDKDFTKHIGMTLGYMNYGFYENAGTGTAFCDEQGNCNYTKVDIRNGVFNTNLNINNEILNQAYYLAALLKQAISQHQQLYARLGGSYSITKINSYVTAQPEKDNIGPSFNTIDNIRNRQKFFPYLALGWQYRINKHLYLDSEVNSNFIIKMYRQTGQLDGRLVPAAIMMGLHYKFN